MASPRTELDVALTEAEKIALRGAVIWHDGVAVGYDLPTIERLIRERVAAGQVEALASAKADIKDRITTFRGLGASEEYLNALNDAWGLVANRERAAIPSDPTSAEEADRG